MQYLTGVYWNRGSTAARNQDSLILQQVLTGRGRVLVAAVCDGMGGLQQGETASGYMAERLQEWFYGFLMRAVHRKKPYWMIRRSIERLVYDAQEQLRQYGRKEQLALGTTMSVLVLWEDTYLIWHMGDSRIYHIHCMRSIQRKNRHSSKLIQKGSRYNDRRIRKGNRYSDKRIRKESRYNGKRITAECMTEDHVRRRNQLTKCVGSFGYYRPDHRMGTAKAEEVFLLCSDGFHHCIIDQELADILSPAQLREEAQMERRLREIGDACMKRGETDNLSAVCIKLIS